jgi:hypothetical protein
MLPSFFIQPVSIVLAIFVSFVFGALWYGPLFGDLWARLIGMDRSKPPKPDEIIRGMILSACGNALTSFVMAHVVQVVRASSWGVHSSDYSSAFYGFICGLFVWIGFYIPLALNGVAWEGRNFGLCFLNIAYYFFHIQIISLIVSMT